MFLKNNAANETQCQYIIIIITNQRLTSSMHQTKHSYRKRCKIKIPFFFRRCIYIYIYTYIKRKIGRIFLCVTGKFSYSLKATQNKYREQQKIKNKFKSIKQKVKKIENEHWTFNAKATSRRQKKNHIPFHLYTEASLKENNRKWNGKKQRLCHQNSNPLTKSMAAIAYTEHIT